MTSKSSGSSTEAKIPLLDLQAQYLALEPEILNAVKSVLRGGHYILGDEVRTLESEMAALCGTTCGIGVASGSDALELALRALGVGPGDEVITTPVTFIATTEAITRVGATPVFVDIDPDDYCMDVNQVEARITERTKAILPVHLFGHPADMDGLRALCNKHSLLMVEDCAQAIGATWKGEPAGSLSEAGTFSFFPSKNLGGYGDGGMVVTSDEDLADHLRFLRVHGSPDKTRYTMEGQNSRLDELQAAMLRVKLAHLETWNALRREHALYYCRGFAYLAREGRIELPTEKPGAKSVYHLFIVRVDDRDGLHAHLNARGISSAVYYRIPMHLQPVYETLGFPAGSFPQAERVCSRFLALPLYPELTTEQLDRVLGAVSEFLSA